jgi:hypothetical protein
VSRIIHFVEKQRRHDLVVPSSNDLYWLIAAFRVGCEDCVPMMTSARTCELVLLNLLCLNLCEFSVIFF